MAKRKPTTAPAPATPDRFRRQSLLPAVLIVVAALVGYHGSFTGAFVFDDLLSIVENATIRRLWPLWHPLTPPRAGGLTVEGRPLINLSLAVNYAVGGLNVWGYHAFNLAVHTLAALVLYGIVRRTLLSDRLRSRFGDAAGGLALAVALIWVVHPLQTEAVTYIVQRAESLMGLFYLLTLYCFIRGAEASAIVGREGSKAFAPIFWYTHAVAVCALGMASKEVMISAPVIVLLYDRTFLSGSFREALRRRGLVYLGLATTWVLLGYLVMSTGMLGSQAGEGEAAIWWRYALTEPGVVVHYLRLAIWPEPLCLDYRWPIAEAWGTILPPVIVVATLLGATMWACQRNSVWGFLGAWFFLILAPTSSVLPLKDLAFEHRMYLPLVAVVAAGVVTLAERLPGKGQRLGWIACAMVAVVLAILTIRRNIDYRSELAIWQDTLRKRPNNARAHLNLGAIFAEMHSNSANTLSQAGRLQEAIRHYEQALRIMPAYAEVHNNLGNALCDAGRAQEAIGHFEQALRIKPGDATMHNNLANALRRLGKVDAAISQYEQALQLKPDYATAHNNLGIALCGLGRIQEAISHHKHALRIQPDSAEAHYNLGIALWHAGKTEEAIRHYEQALRIRPDYAEAHNNLGGALYTLGRTQLAIAHYEQALRIRPDYVDAQNNLAEAQAALRAAGTGKPVSHR